MAKTMAVKRIRKEVKDIMESDEMASGLIKLELIDDNWLELRGEIKGPADTPYEGGVFKLEIKIPEAYPFEPPKIRFVTKVWHPNISSVTGAICLDILKDQWAAALSLRTILISIQALLSAAEPKDPQDAVVAKQYMDNLELFNLTAKHWTNIYAGGHNRVQEFDQKVHFLQEMGVEEQESRDVLSTNNWDVGRAADKLFN